jgi:protease secretion system outer membrane protein
VRFFPLGVLIAASCWSAGAAMAQSPVFLRAYELALANDPAYRSALKEHEASQFNREIGNAAVRPVVSLTQTSSTNHSSRTLLDNAGRVQHDDPKYLSANTSLALRQPLITYEGMARQKIGETQALYGQAVLANKRQDLLLRLLKAWTELHFAQDQVRLAKSQLEAYAEQLKLNEAILKQGEGTRTDVLETRSKYEITLGQLLEADLEVANKQRALEAIVGTKDAPALAGLNALIDIDRLEDGTLQEDHWVDLALASNPEIRSLEMQVELSRLEVERAQSGHMPKLDLTISRSRSRSDTLNTLNQNIQNTSLGVQLSVPIYAGGQISAAVSQALAVVEQQRAELEKKSQEIRTEIRKQINAVKLNRQKKQALVRAVQAAQELVLASRKSAKAGVKVNLEVLNAVQQVYLHRRDLALASYTLLNSWAGLRAAAGQAGDDVVRQIALAITH